MNAAASLCPAILVAAPASGQGKTTITTALARLHARAGRRVRAFKSGPDFLDPLWLELATGHPAHNLDLWMTGEADVRARLFEAAQTADLIIVEGVMGLFDGSPSAADIAQRFGLKVLAVIDASAMAGTFGALAFGLQHFRPGMPWAGVLANRVASERHAEMLEMALMGEGAHAAAASSSPCSPSSWMGAVMRDASMVLPERHLGLTAAHELPDAMARLDAAADALALTPLGRMDEEALASWSVRFEPPVDGAAVPPLLAGKTIAVARDAAFCFVYAANLEILRGLGAELVFFSPLANEEPPPCDAVWLPGGYPELHAEALARSHAARDGLIRLVDQGVPVWAECGGMMVLFDAIVDASGQRHSLWGVLPGVVTMQTRLAALGPQRLVSTAGELRGHTFHYSKCETEAPAVLSTESMRVGKPGAGEAVYQRGNLRASYFHAWMPSSPAATAALFLKGAL